MVMLIKIIIMMMIILTDNINGAKVLIAHNKME